MKKLALTAFTLAVLAGCASTDGTKVASREETYIPLGSLLPRKAGQGKDERTQVDKEEFRRQAEMTRAEQGQ